jgi:flagellar basal-body rod protein FlgC
MMDSLVSSIRTAGSGLEAQATRVRVVSENIANATSTSKSAGGDPYQRKTVSFMETVERDTGANIISVAGIARDLSEFSIEFDPGNPAADENGNVKLPNVNPIIEMADMREANRSYEANIQVIKQARDLISMTIDLMRAS